MSRYLMTLEEKAQRRERALDLFGEGVKPSDIAKRLGMSANYVRLLITEAQGPMPEADNYGSQVSQLWKLDEDQRRAAIARKAAQGARERLDELAFER